MIAFMKDLANYIDTLDIPMPLQIELLNTEETVALVSAPGGQTLRKYFDGATDKRLQYDFCIKTKDTVRALKTLETIANALVSLDVLNTEAEAYEFLNITVSNEAFFTEATEDGYYYYQLTIHADLTILKNE